MNTNIPESYRGNDMVMFYLSAPRRFSIIHYPLPPYEKKEQRRAAVMRMIEDGEGRKLAGMTPLNGFSDVNWAFYEKALHFENALEKDPIKAARFKKKGRIELSDILGK